MGEQPIIRLGSVQEDPEKPTFWELQDARSVSLPASPVRVYPPSGWEGNLLQSQPTDVETKLLSHSVITCLRDR